jgi:hypothetical protein
MNICSFIGERISNDDKRIMNDEVNHFLIQKSLIDIRHSK